MMAIDADSAIERLEWLCSEFASKPARFQTTVVAAHPDDEIIGAGVRLARLRRVAVIFLTNGSPRNMLDAEALGFASVEQYATSRHHEALAALFLCGVSKENVASLNVPDQEAAYNLVTLSRSLAAALEHTGADIVLTHPYEGGHPDHDAAAFCTRPASTLLERSGVQPPAVLEFTSYHARGDQMEIGRFLETGGSVKTLPLSSREQRQKRQMFAKYSTQQRVLEQFPVLAESFRVSPNYDFKRVPDAPIYYDRFDWGLKSRDWPRLTSNALSELGLDISTQLPGPDDHPQRCISLRSRQS